MKNSPAIRRAIRAYMVAQGLSSRALAEKLGCTNTAASRWIAEAGIQTKTISTSHWCKLYPLIRQYLPPEYTTVQGSATAQEPRTVVPAPPDKHIVPVLGAAAAAGYDQALEPLGEFDSHHPLAVLHPPVS